MGLNGTTLECSSACGCARGKFDPVCLGPETGGNQVTYISPCLAGCTTGGGHHNSSTDRYYSDCSCGSNLPESFDSKESDSWFQQAKPGLCKLQCNTLHLYILVFSLTVLIHSTTEVGSMLLTLRCVEPQDKAMALGFISFATGLFGKSFGTFWNSLIEFGLYLIVGNVPCPIIYGAIVDSACLFWEEDECGRRGACRLYDSDRFRWRFHGITAFIMFLAFCIDVVVCYKAAGIQFHEEEEAGEKDEKEKEDATPTASNVQNPESVC
jgi:hypothetical protein